MLDVLRGRRRRDRRDHLVERDAQRLRPRRVDRRACAACCRGSRAPGSTAGPRRGPSAASRTWPSAQPERLVAVEQRLHGVRAGRHVAPGPRADSRARPRRRPLPGPASGRARRRRRPAACRGWSSLIWKRGSPESSFESSSSIRPSCAAFSSDSGNETAMRREAAGALSNSGANAAPPSVSSSRSFMWPSRASAGCARRSPALRPRRPLPAAPTAASARGAAAPGAAA